MDKRTVVFDVVGDDTDYGEEDDRMMEFRTMTGGKCLYWLSRNRTGRMGAELTDLMCRRLAALNDFEDLCSNWGKFVRNVWNAEEWRPVLNIERYLQLLSEFVRLKVTLPKLRHWDQLARSNIYRLAWTEHDRKRDQRRQLHHELMGFALGNLLENHHA